MKRRDLLKLLGVALFLPKAVAAAPAPASSAWDTDAYSLGTYPLESPPLSFGSLDYCWHVGEDGIARIYEGDVMVGEFGQATPFTVFTITEDNGLVTYAKDKHICRTRHFKCS